MKGPLTVADLRNPKRQSGYDHVSTRGSSQTRPKPFYAEVNAGAGKNKRAYRGPCRASAARAAQDYCDYVNANPTARQPHKNKSAGHKRPQQPKRPVPKEVRDALGVLRDYKAQQAGVQGYVYLITEARDGGGLVYGKIGYSTNPEKRLAELQTGNPRKLILLYSMKGTEADERRLHAKYAPQNVLQEWFRITKELILEFPANTSKTGKVDIAA